MHRNAVVFATLDASQSRIALACKAWYQLTTYMVLDWKRVKNKMRSVNATLRAGLKNLYIKTWGVHPIGPWLVHEEMFIPAVPALAILQLPSVEQ